MSARWTSLVPYRGYVPGPLLRDVRVRFATLNAHVANIYSIKIRCHLQNYEFKQLTTLSMSEKILPKNFVVLNVSVDPVSAYYSPQRQQSRLQYTTQCYIIT